MRPLSRLAPTLLLGLAWSSCADPLGGAERTEAGPQPDDAAADAPGVEAPPADSGKDLPDGEPADAAMCPFFINEGPDLGVPNCPAMAPVEGGDCKPPGGIGVCRYGNDACDTDDWTCPFGVNKWKLTRGRACSTCPDAPPAEGASCILGEWRRDYRCAWPKSGGFVSATCSYNCRWQVGQSLNAPECPAALPASGDACSGTSACRYAARCHALDTATCVQGKWQVKPGACS